MPGLQRVCTLLPSQQVGYAGEADLHPAQPSCVPSSVTCGAAAVGSKYCGEAALLPSGAWRSQPFGVDACHVPFLSSHALLEAVMEDQAADAAGGQIRSSLRCRNHSEWQHSATQPIHLASSQEGLHSALPATAHPQGRLPGWSAYTMPGDSAADVARCLGGQMHAAATLKAPVHGSARLLAARQAEQEAGCMGLAMGGPAFLEQQAGLSGMAIPVPAAPIDQLRGQLKRERDQQLQDELDGMYGRPRMGRSAPKMELGFESGSGWADSGNQPAWDASCSMMPGDLALSTGMSNSCPLFSRGRLASCASVPATDHPSQHRLKQRAVSFATPAPAAPAMFTETAMLRNNDSLELPHWVSNHWLHENDAGIEQLKALQLSGCVRPNSNGADAGLQPLQPSTATAFWDEDDTSDDMACSTSSHSATAASDSSMEPEYSSGQAEDSGSQALTDAGQSRPVGSALQTRSAAPPAWIHALRQRGGQPVQRSSYMSVSAPSAELHVAQHAIKLAVPPADQAHVKGAVTADQADMPVPRRSDRPAAVPDKLQSRSLKRKSAPAALAGSRPGTTQHGAERPAPATEREGAGSLGVPAANGATRRADAGGSVTGQAGKAGNMAVTRAPVAGSEQLQSIDLESLRDGGYLDMPIVEAAQELGMSLSALKGLAHEQGIQRWPYRSRQSIRALIEQTVQHIKGGSLGLHGAREEEALLEALQGDLEDVGAGRTPCLSSAIKRYRQWMFKLKHNRKKSPGSRMVVPRRVIAAFSR